MLCYRHSDPAGYIVCPVLLEKHSALSAYLHCTYISPPHPLDPQSLQAWHPGHIFYVVFLRVSTYGAQEVDQAPPLAISAEPVSARDDPRSHLHTIHTVSIVLPPSQII
jgi:hypothetical protein